MVMTVLGVPRLQSSVMLAGTSDAPSASHENDSLSIAITCKHSFPTYIAMLGYMSESASSEFGYIFAGAHLITLLAFSPTMQYD